MSSSYRDAVLDKLRNGNKCYENNNFNNESIKNDEVIKEVAQEEIYEENPLFEYREISDEENNQKRELFNNDIYDENGEVVYINETINDFNNSYDNLDTTSKMKKFMGSEKMIYVTMLLISIIITAKAAYEVLINKEAELFSSFIIFGVGLAGYSIYKLLKKK